MLTVILPVYNAEKTLEKMLDSVLNQTYRDYEFLIINDGSEDNTRNIIERYAKKDERIRCITIENSGVAAARQLGLENAGGEYLIFIDSDDFLEQQMLEKLLQCVKDNYEAACCSFVIDDNGINKECRIEGNINEITSSELMHKYLIREFRGALWCWIFKKDLFKGFHFPENCVLSDDFTAIIHVLTHTSLIGVVDYIGYHYIQYSSSLSRKGFTDRHINYFYNMQHLKEVITEAYPQYEKEAIVTFAVNEMALLPAMCRNGNYNHEIEEKVVALIRKNLMIILRSSYIPAIYKLSALCISFSKTIFMKGYAFALKVLKFDLNRYNLTFGKKD